MGRRMVAPDHIIYKLYNINIYKCFEFNFSFPLPLNLSIFIRKLRLHKPWNYKAPCLMTVPYSILYSCSAEPTLIIESISWSLLTTIGIAGCAYLLNDLSDVRQDEVAGKPNVAGETGAIRFFLLLSIFASIALLPWVIFFPLSQSTIALLLIEIILLYSYSFLPFRLKEKGFVGVIADSQYAHVIPAALAALTFRELMISRGIWKTDQTNVFTFWLLTMLAWQFLLGIRNILLHQLDDHDSDLRSKVRTFTTSMGPAAVWKLLRNAIVPAELFAFLVFLFMIAIYFPWLIPVIIIFLINSLVMYRKIKGNRPEDPLRTKLYLFVDEFINSWLPSGILLSASLFHPPMWLAFGIHLIVFRNPIKEIALSIWKS